MDCKKWNIVMRFRQGIGLFMIGMLFGCTTGTVAPPVPQRLAFFPSEAGDRLLFQGLAKQIEPSFETCRHQGNCDEVYFTRGLLALFEDRDVAAASFREVLKTTPADPLAISSQGWLRLLSEKVPVTHDAALAENTKTMVHLLVTRMRTQSAVACGSVVEASQRRGTLLQGLQRRIQARDRQIAELTDQLRALKQIDLDGNVNRKVGPFRKIQAEK